MLQNGEITSFLNLEASGDLNCGHCFIQSSSTKVVYREAPKTFVNYKTSPKFPPARVLEESKYIFNIL